MKELIESLKRSLNSRGKTFDITGKELMEVYLIAEKDFSEYRMNCDTIHIIAPIQYVKDIDEMFELCDDVFWKIKGENEPKHITSSLNKVYDDCYCFMTSILLKKNIKGYFINLSEYVNRIKNISRNEKISFSIALLENVFINICFKNKKIISVEFDEIDFDICDIEIIKKLFYRLLIYSYDVPLRETLSILRLL